MQRSEPLRRRHPAAVCAAVAALAVLLPSAHATDPPAKAAAAEQAQTLSADDRQILEAVEDGGPRIADEALAVILHRAAALVDAATGELAEFDRPAYADLLATPARYRGRCVRMTVFAAYLTKLEPADLQPRVFDPTAPQIPLWQLDCFAADTRYPAESPLRVLCLVDPADIIGPGEPGAAYGESRYTRTPTVEVSGLFYKTYSDASRSDAAGRAQVRSYPLLVAFAVGEADLPGELGSTGATGVSIKLVLGLIIGLTVLLVWLRTSVRRRTRPASAVWHKPLGDPAWPRADDVDPDLKAAAREHRNRDKSNDQPENNS